MYFLGILLGEAGLFCELAVDAAAETIETKGNTMFRAHRIRRFFIARLAIDALGDLDAFDIDHTMTQRRLDGNRATDTDGHAILAIALTGFKCENLAERTYIDPSITGRGSVFRLVFFRGL